MSVQCLVQAKAIYYVKHIIKGSKATEQRYSKKGFNFPSKGAPGSPLVNTLHRVVCNQAYSEHKCPLSPLSELVSVKSIQPSGRLEEAKLLVGPQLILGERNKQQKQ